MRRYGFLLLLLLIQGCGDVVWFVSFNSGFVAEDGLIVVIGSPRDPQPASIRVVEGDLPAGMKLQNDGTVRGTPEEAGPFDFTLEFSDAEGFVDRENFSGELEQK